MLWNYNINELPSSQLALQGDNQAVADELLVVAVVGLVHLLGGVRRGRDGEGEVRCLARQEWRWDFFSG